MKTLCVVVVVVALSLSSVCQAASLGCTKLLKPVAEALSINGTWYCIAISMQNCSQTSPVGEIFQGIVMDVASTDNLNIYDMTITMKLGSYCISVTDKVLYENKTFFGVDANNTATYAREELLQTGCSDCLVVKEMENKEILMLLSRRNQITSEEKTKFDELSQCLGYSKPFVLERNHEHKNCTSTDGLDDDFAEHEEARQNLERRLPKCLKELLMGD